MFKYILAVRTFLSPSEAPSHLYVAILRLLALGATELLLVSIDCLGGLEFQTVHVVWVLASFVQHHF